MCVPRKLIYCLFGDHQSIEVVTAGACELKAPNKIVSVSPDLNRSDGCWIWTGEIAVTGERHSIWPIVFAIIKPPFDSGKWIKDELGFDQTECLRIMGGERSRNVRPYGFAKFISGRPNEAHLRDFGRYPLKDFGQQVANQAIESFVMSQRLRPRQRPIRLRPTFSVSRCYSIPAPYASSLDGSEIGDRILVEGSVG